MLNDAARGLLAKGICNSESEFISYEFTACALRKGIPIDYIQSGSPEQNAYISLSNLAMRYGCANKHLFDTLGKVQDYVVK